MKKKKKKTVSQIMSRIRSKNTSIEVKLRKALWKEKIRYRKNYGKLPGKPDIAITKYKIAVFCDGEFWHGKNWDEYKEKIKGNREYWVNKIENNIKRELEVDKELKAGGWEVLHFWGKDIEKNLDKCVEEVKNILFYKKINYEPDADLLNESEFE